MHSFSKYIEGLSQNFVPVISSEFSNKEYIAIDLSKNSAVLENIDVSSSQAFEECIHQYLLVNKAKVAYGGYHEVRGIYSRSMHFNQQDPMTERSIHLGLDIWCNAATAVIAPLNGKVHSFKNNNNFGDYGPTIILEHTIGGVSFYTLYGHLSVTSIHAIKIGQEFDRGAIIGNLGDSSVNGDYAPHLHFQIIKDMQGNFGDYPGVSNKMDMPYYIENCPDPNLLLKI
ncbi:peptidoglycan DD-metalloendopeptidase family protein [Aquimarina sp. RZ0]|uniref:peptidoglycan DD-metalloendopeptidase family protein n=1 Tax=Aquimarina sp. RZ0 TaxID=2607730 RepID=UPI0011F32C77|nr:peptidoglycan DD-metalloendopeptidase family protein [Aquimarina sp. RZ0]KAA1246747.1 peptidoglycan DD-metalloendopeptidase family protein [Aquimarina sp. RZ0]